MESLKVGPPFTGITDNPFDSTGKCLLSMNYFCRNDRLQRRPGWSLLRNFTSANLGIRGFGKKRDKSVLVAVGESSDLVNVTLIGNDGSVGTDVTSSFAVTNKGPVTFASMYGKLYIAGGGQVLVVDPELFTCAPLVMTAGKESASKTYLKQSPPARSICTHLGRMWYSAFESADLLVYGTLADDAAYVDDTSWIADEYHVNYKPWHILYSDSAHPEQVQSIHNFALQDDGAPITAIHPFRGGLLILTTQAAWYLSGTGPADWRIDKLGKGGCIAPASVDSDETAVYWLGPDGLYWMGDDLIINSVSGVSWLWNGDKPIFAALLGSNTRVFPRLRLGLHSDAIRQNATGVCDHKQGGYLLSRVLYNLDPQAATAGDTYDVGIWVDSATKTVTLVAPCPVVIGKGGDTDLGSTISDIIGGLGVQLFAWQSDEYADGGVYTTSLNAQMPAQYVSTFKEASPAYLSISGVRVFSPPQDLSVSAISWERMADADSAAGANGSVNGDGVTSPDVWGDETMMPRWVAESATTGIKYLPEAATTGIRWGSELPGAFKADVIGHGKAVAVSITDAQEEGSCPVLGIMMDAEGEGNS